MGSDKAPLIEFFCARSPRRVRAAKKAWEERHDTSLVDRISSELASLFTKSPLRALCLQLLKGHRSRADGDTAADEGTAGECAARLHHAEESPAEVFSEVLGNASPAQAAAIAAAYEDAYDRSLRKCIEANFSGGYRNALLALAGADPVDWFAARLRSALKSFSTADRTVCRVLGTHDKREILAIAAAYDRK